MFIEKVRSDLITHHKKLEDSLKSKFSIFVKRLKNTTDKEICGENMAISLIDINESEEETIYTFWWNHFQNSANHLFKFTVNKEEDFKLLEIISNTYNFKDFDNGTEILREDPVDLYKMVIQMENINNYLEQLEN